MNPPEKSSDEILQELFGLCLQQAKVLPGLPSEDESSDSSDNEAENHDRPKKHKHKRKKKKKHKKLKKRKVESTDDEESDSKSHRRMNKKIKKEPEDSDKSVPASIVELKIKTERNDSAEISNKPLNSSESPQNKENKSNNYVNTITGKYVTLDDVFHTLGIVTVEENKSKIKQEKGYSENISSSEVKQEEFTLLRPDQIKKEKIDGNVEVKQVKKEKKSTDGELQSKKEQQPQETATSTTLGELARTSLSQIFTDEADKQISSSKKISIKNLKNSVVYEATMKEIEEREKRRAEKYEEGELSTDSSSSEDDSVDSDSKDENTQENSSQPPDERKKKHKSREKKKKHRSHSHKKKHHRHSESKSEHKSSRKHKKSDHDPQSRSDSSRSHPHHHESVRSRSVESETSLASRRSHRSTHRCRRSSRDRSTPRSHSRTKLDNLKSKSGSVEKIDKQKLLEIARKNAINLLQQGAIPGSIIAGKTKIASIKAGGKTVDELTDFCKQLSRKEAEGDDSDHLSSGSENCDTKIAFHHPFQLKERPSSIIMNIRNAITLPTKTAQEKTLELSKQLSLQYPVSSGQQHKSEWVPVEKCDNIHSTHTSSSYSNALVDPTAMVTYPLPQSISYPIPKQYQPPPLPKTDSILPPSKNIDISSVVAQRLEAIRRLSENPKDPIGANLIQTANSKMTVWAESKVQPGLFTGSTGVKPLSVAELSGGFKAWPKKVDILTFSRMLPRLIKIPGVWFALKIENQFIAAKPVCSDKGEALMKKMGWQPGEGLGKYKQGPAAPCEISMKTDRKGLAEQPMPKGFKQSNTLQKAIEITQNKHPVSLLNEYCSRRKLPTPQYDCDEKEGTGKRKLFVFSVTVQGIRYTPKMPSTNKKQSKMEAATVCLQSLGLLPVIAPNVGE